MLKAKIDNLMDEISSYNNIKYAAYRVALKFGTLQKYVWFNQIPVRVVSSILDKHQIFATDNSVILTEEQLESILHDIYFIASKENKEVIDINFFINFMKYILNKIINGNITDFKYKVLDLKILLISLCNSPVQLKYRFWFSHLCDYNLCLQSKNLNSLLSILFNFIVFLNETKTFPHEMIAATIQTCFIQTHILGISEQDFINWTLKEPQILVWLSTTHRIKLAENVIHSVKCEVCNNNPIKGLRYTCLKCINYNMCQWCFFYGKKSRSHRTKHMIQEYCTKVTRREASLIFVKAVLSRLFGNRNRIQYLPAYSNTSNNQEINCLSNEPIKQEVVFDELTKLREIIEQIQIETKKIQMGINNGTDKFLLNDYINKIQQLTNEFNSYEVISCSNSVRNTVEFTSSLSEIEDQVVNCSVEEWNIASTNRNSITAWLDGSSADTTSTQQLQNDLDNILLKLQNLLDNNFSRFSED